jgi:hypothetical protein
MGPSRKRARTKYPNVDDSAAEPHPPAERPEPRTAVADTPDNVSRTKVDAPTPLKTPASDIKTGGSSARDVSIHSFSRLANMYVAPRQS